MYLNDKIVLRTQYAIYNDTFDIYIKSGERGFVRDIIFEEVERPGRHVEPSIRIEKTEAQLLMDDLWNCGIRPTEGSGSAGSLKATENHLDDMRKIVFSKLGIKC